MAPNLPPPPSRPNLYDIDRSNSPTFVEENLPTAVSGLELTVYGLDKSAPPSAAEHLRKIFRELEAAPPSPSHFLAYANALVVRQADLRNALDYAYVSLNQDEIPQPRADLLQELRQILTEAYPTLRASWRVHSGPDKTRRISFAVDSKAHGEQVQAGMDEWLKRRNIGILSSFIYGRDTVRLSYDLINPEHVDAIFSSPPVLGNHTFYPTRPRFVVPSYGYQVAALGCRDWQAARPTLDQFVRAYCPRDDGTDPLSCSYMALDGDVYTAVLTDWDTAVKIAQGQDVLERYLKNDPFGRYISPPQLGLLFGLNSSGLFLRQGIQERHTFETQQVRNELDNLRQQGTEAMKTVYAVQAENSRMIGNVNMRLEGIMTTVTTMAAGHSIQSQIAQLENALSDLRHDRSMAQMMTSMANLHDDVRQQQLIRVRRCEEEMDERRQNLNKLRSQQDALNHTISSSLSTIGVPPGLLPPSGSGSATRSLGTSSMNSDEDAPSTGLGTTHGAQGVQPMDEES